MPEERPISYVAFEGEMTRMERTNKRLWILCILLLISLLGTNLGWIYYESQWEVLEETQEITQQAEANNGGNAIINGEGEVTINGESDTDNQDY